MRSDHIAFVLMVIGAALVLWAGIHIKSREGNDGDHPGSPQNEEEKR